MAAYAALVSLKHIIDTLENHNRPPIYLPKTQVHLLTQNITSLQQFLEAYNPNLPYKAEADPLETRIADAAYAAEDVIESHIVDHLTNDGERMNSESDDAFHEAVEKVIEEMALIELQTVSVGLQHHQRARKRLCQSKPTSPDSSRSSSVAQVQQSRMVGADKLLFQMKDKLISDRLDLQVIPIVGMGGSGKTTLARNIYQDRLIMEHFYIRAWVTISQDYSIREILLQLLMQLNKQASQDLSVGELGEMLHKHLFGRKYVIVLDDMWNIEAWEGVRMFFPNSINGSRIVVTTRLSNLASKLSNSSLKMNLLDEDDSWDLLSKTVFGEKDCPIEFKKIGKEIGKSCKGLPLSIVVVGGLLAKSEHTIAFWESIKENLNSVVNLEDDERYLKILYMSYKQLPVHLKPCFLYMGVFPEDQVIRTKKLVRLWVSEGFLKPISKKNMEEIAKEYLEDLIGRNLIMICMWGSTGRVKGCQIHDLLRDLCLREAVKERFYSVVASRPQGIVNNAAQRRIVVPSSISKDEAINAMSFMPLARSLIWNLEERLLPPLNLRLLRILDSGYRATDTCLESVYQLVNSRYINISHFECPYSIVRFWNLQTLFCGYAQLGPRTIFLLDMIHIRHIRCFWTEFDTDQLQGDNIVLGNLQTLKGLKNFKCSKEIVKRIPNIKKLSVEYFDEFSDKYCLTNLICLDKLESFSCEILSGCESLERIISFPNSLIKLHIGVDEAEIFWQEILDKIGSLPLLQKLKLTGGTFREGQWETTQGQFLRLKMLVLDSCRGLHVWKTEGSHFPCLERLHLSCIDELKEIPLDFAKILTLKEVVVFYCSDSVVESVKRIVEEQEELYGDQEEEALQVRVTLPKDRNQNAALESLASPNFHVTTKIYFTGKN